MRKLLLAAGLMCSIATSQALADQRCRQVQLNITNNTGQTIRVFRLRYFDVEDQRMRTNDIGNLDILNGYTGSMRETLEYVGNEAIGNVSVQYRIGTTGDRQWSQPGPSGIDRCIRDIYLNHTITGPAS